MEIEWRPPTDPAAWHTRHHRRQLLIHLRANKLMGRTISKAAKALGLKVKRSEFESVTKQRLIEYLVERAPSDTDKGEDSDRTNSDSALD
jgi:hypothetical protein